MSNKIQQGGGKASPSLACSPFPWVLDLPGECIRRADGEIIAETHISSDICRDEADANARLIAAIPHMLEAIRGFEAGDDFAGWCSSYRPAIRAARKALRIISENANVQTPR